MPAPTELTFKRAGEVLSVWTLGPGTYVIGRSEADLCVDDESISDRHALLTIMAHAVFINDMGSETGTFLNDKRIESSTRLFPNQKLRFGSAVFLEVCRKRDSSASEEATSTGKVHLERLIPGGKQSRYDIGDQIAQGGMGAILQVRDTPIRRTVAMKVMLLDATERAVGRFIEEAQITGQLEHPNIVPVHELGIDEHEQPFYTMKYVRGVTLHEVITKLRSGDARTLLEYPLGRLLTIFQKVCDAIAFAHSRHVVHRDLKPENVMIGSFGEVLVMDWGLAKVISSEPKPKEDVFPPALSEANISLPSVNISETLVGAIIGTPQFMSPEQARGETETIDTRSDVYSLGTILFMILYLRAPYEGKTREALLDNVRSGRIALNRRDDDGVLIHEGPFAHLPGGRPPESLLAVAIKAMALERVNRYQEVSALQAEISAYQNGFATSAENASFYRLMLLAIGRYKRETAIALAAVLVLLTVGITAFLKVSRERQRAETVLNELRNAAPAFAAQASSLIAEERFSEALEKLNYANKLCPNEPWYLASRGDVMESQQQFALAARAYREAERLDPGQVRARSNAVICERLEAERVETGKVSRESLTALLDLMAAEKRSPILMMPIARMLGEQHRVALEYCRERLRDFPLTPDRPLDQRLVVRPDGLLRLDLSDTTISDLQPLSGMPLAELDLRRCTSVRNLEPLAKVPLRRLILDSTGVADLRPLIGQQIEDLSLRDTAVSQLSPLMGMRLVQLDCSHLSVQNFDALVGAPIQRLVLSGAKVQDLKFLRGMPLRTLYLDGCSEARGYDLLFGLRSLETLVLPTTFYELPAEDLSAVQMLQRHRGLKQISARPLDTARPGNLQSADSFWNEWASDLKWLQPARAATGNPAFTRLLDRTWEVSFRNEKTLENISFLKGARISKLDLASTIVSDLSPLAGIPIRSLDLRNSKVADISHLRGMPLSELYLYGTAVTDFTPLSTMSELKILDLSELPITDLSVLRSKKLELLRIGSTKVRDLSPLAGLPLRVFHGDNVEVSDVRPLTQCPELRWIVLPNNVSNVQLLKQLPKLERISEKFGHESMPVETAKEYWERHDRERKAPAP
jgi:serine/threonine protein kinase/Leucine-rich repeat (LRR) protein